MALRRSRPYLAPAAAGASAVWLVLGLPADVGRVLFLVAGAVLCAVFVAVHRIQPGRHEPPWVRWRLGYKLSMSGPRPASAPGKAGWTAEGGPQGRGGWSWLSASNSAGGR